jgi:4-hydroxyproline epimerase
MKRLSVIDSHTGGEPTRVVLGGLGAEDLPRWHRALLCEPRGHEVIVGALLEDPEDPANSAKVTFFNNAGLLGMCGHGSIGVIETLRHLGRIGTGAHRIETPVGTVTAVLREDGSVGVRNVLSRREAASVTAGGFTGDVAWGGNWFFLVSDHGRDLTLTNIHELTRAALEAREAVRAAGFPEVDHVEFLGPPRDPGNHSRNFVLCPGGEYDRSPCGTGTSAKLACLAADGKLAPGAIWRQESIIGTVFEGSYEIDEGGIVPTITGRAHVVAETVLLFGEDDPFRWGIGGGPDRGGIVSK